MNPLSTLYTPHRLLSLGLLLACLPLVGCGEHEELEVPQTCQQELRVCEAEAFLSVDQFEFLRQEDAITILDARGDDMEFQGGHIPGAKFIDMSELRDPDNHATLWDDDERLTQHFEELGIRHDRPIAIYGAGDGGGVDSRAGNIFWTFHYLGHDDVYLVDGGLAAWVNADFAPIRAGQSPEPSVEGDFPVERNDDLVAGFEDVHQAIDNGSATLLDTRTEGEFTGEDERGNPQAGHIPTAVHYHWEDLMNDDGLLRDQETLRDELEETGLTPDTPVIAYCQSGVRSGFFYAVLLELGYSTVQNYDGSWMEWSREATEDDIATPETSS